MVISEFMQLPSVQIFLSIFGTVVTYLAFKSLYLKSGRKLYLMPLLACPILIGVFLLTFDIPYGEYQLGSQYISLLLQPATVAFAVPLYKFRHTIKKYAVQLTTVIGFACVMALISSVGLASLVGLSHDLVLSVAPRSVTTPLAIAASNVLGGNPTITAVLVIVTGIVGMIMTTIMIKKTGIHNQFLKGMLLGITAHGTGTAKAYEDGPKTGVLASLAMIFMGIFTTVIAPLIATFSFAL